MYQSWVLFTSVKYNYIIMGAKFSILVLKGQLLGFLAFLLH